MSSANPGSDRPQVITFAARPCQQGSARMFTAAMKASALLGLYGRTLRRDGAEAEAPTIESEEDLRAYVRASSAGANLASDVEIIQQIPYTETEPFQRLIEETRVRKIAQYLLSENAVLPNAIIVAAREYVDVLIDPDAECAGAVRITMKWIEGEKPLNVIDGQHRLEAIRRLLADGHSRFSDYELSVTFLFDLPYFEQAEMFSVINGTQKPVNRSRIYDLLGYLPTKDEALREKAYAGDMAIYRFCHQIVRVLNRSQASPWTSRIKMRGEGSGVVTQAAFVDQLANFVQPRKSRARMNYLPVFYRYFRSAELLGAAKACVLYFQGIADAWPSYWEDDAKLKASLFGKTNGVVVMLMILHDLAVLRGGVERVEVSYVRENWQKVAKGVIDSPPAGGSRGYQRQIRTAVLTQMFGDGFEVQLNAAKENMRDVLLAEGAIY